METGALVEGGDDGAADGEGGWVQGGGEEGGEEAESHPWGIGVGLVVGGES